MLLVAGFPTVLGQESAPPKTLGERFGINAESCPDPNGGNDAGVNISIHTGSAATEETSDFCHRERSLDPFDLFGKGNRWVRYISHLIEDDSTGDKLTIIRTHQ
jgi:hypothetical protein